MRTRAVVGLLALVTVLVPCPTSAQRPDKLAVVGPGGAAGVPIPVAYHRGYAAIPLGALRRIGWVVTSTGVAGEARREDVLIVLRERSPFFRWSDALLQLTGDAYRFGGDLWVPMQLVSDFLPQRRPQELAFHPEGPSIEVMVAAAWTPEVSERLSRESVAPPVVPSSGPALPPASRPSVAKPSRSAPTTGGAPAARAPARPVPASAPSRARVVVIDAGHGGEDSGARGPRGSREKDVALKLALALARVLERDADVEVHLTRSQDRLVPLWERGEWATGVKGERPGVFISLHANAEISHAASGFETYFLSEARTEHERRVAAAENEPFRQAAAGGGTGDDPELDGIVKELRTFGDQHWSALLAELVQDEMARVHPGPNRGVKQGPLAVITNSLMPAVLVEVGFISNREEERLLDNPKFEADAAAAIARAVERFFDRYSPRGNPAGSAR